MKGKIAGAPFPIRKGKDSVSNKEKNFSEQEGQTLRLRTVKLWTKRLFRSITHVITDTSLSVTSYSTGSTASSNQTHEHVGWDSVSKVKLWTKKLFRSITHAITDVKRNAVSGIPLVKRNAVSGIPVKL